MRKSRYTEEQMIGFIKQAEAGMPIKELDRKGGCGDATFCKWRAKCGGMDVPDAERLRELEGENVKIKKLLAEAHLDIYALCGRAVQPRRPRWVKFTLAITLKWVRFELALTCRLAGLS